MFKPRTAFIGVDVGGTKILLQTFDRKLQLINEERVLTQTRKGEKAFTDQLLDLMERHFSRHVKAIGIAVPGIVHREKGILVKAPHLPTKKDYPLKEILEEFFKRPVTVDNDINAFLWAEKERPGLKKCRNIVAVMIGTGVGGAILNDRKLIYGASGYAGEVGHMVIRQDGALKTLEQNTSGIHVPEIAKLVGAKAADAGDPKVKKYVLEQLGIGLSNLCLIFNPEVIVLGGSVYHYHLAGQERKLEAMIAQRSLDKKAPKLTRATRKTSVARGAAMLAAGL